MSKRLMRLAVVLCCAMTAVFTACKNDPNPPSGEGGDVTGSWYAEVTGKTFALWNFGPVWQHSRFNADSTGYTVIYYFYGDKLIGIEQDEFTYTAENGVLSMTLTEHQQTISTAYSVRDDKLALDNEIVPISLTKMTDEVAAKFNEWSKTEKFIPVPHPAKHTVFVYGNAGGDMDNVIENGFWKQAKSFLTDETNVRVICFYKYGTDEVEEGYHSFRGQFAEPGDIVWFELNSQTELEKIKEDGMQAQGWGDDAKELKLCSPKTLRFFMEISSLFCPAEKYTFAIWGHGAGFEPIKDIPGKYDLANLGPRRAKDGLIADDWNNREALDMYELSAAIKATGRPRLYTIFFHNCLMGNIESLTEIRDCADYICASSHLLSSRGEVLTEFVRGLVDKGNTEDAVAQMFERITPDWQDSYQDDDPSERGNGDYKLIRTDKINGIMDVAKRLSDRLIALYPTQQEAIDKATRQVYRFAPVSDEFLAPFFDIADYAHHLAKETGDAEFAQIATDMDRAFSETLVHYRDINWCKDWLNHYTLSVCLVRAALYSSPVERYPAALGALCNFQDGYEQCSFHKYTGWGNWLNLNQQAMDGNPRSGDGEDLQ